MTTVTQIINLALKDTGMLAAGETAHAEDANDAFTTLVQMVGQWQSDGLMVYAHSDVSFAATGATSYTIGSGGNVNTTRPTEIVGGYWRDGSSDFPLDVRTFEEYQSIGYKTNSGAAPDAVFYNPTYPLGTLYFWPQPTTGTFHLTLRAPLPAYATLTESIAVPPEYELALRYSLGEMLTPEDDSPRRSAIIAMARRARKILKRSNVKIPVLGMPAAVLGRGRSDIVSGQL